MEIQDELRMRMPDPKSFELYMWTVKAICRDTVIAAVKSQKSKVDESWARAVARGIEAQLRDSSVNPRTAHLSILTGPKK